jgi:hypothetical protein
MLSGLLRSGRSWIERENRASLASVGNEGLRLYRRESSSGVETRDDGFKARLKRRVDRLGGHVEHDTKVYAAPGEPRK